MAALNPKMAEIRARLKDEPDKMNQEIAAFYKREKVNPLLRVPPPAAADARVLRLVQPAEQLFRASWSPVRPGWIPTSRRPNGW